VCHFFHLCIVGRRLEVSHSLFSFFTSLPFVLNSTFDQSCVCVFVSESRIKFQVMFNCLSPRNLSLEGVDAIKPCPKCRRPLTMTKLTLQDTKHHVAGKCYYICSHCSYTIQANTSTDVDQKLQDTLRLVSKFNIHENGGSLRESILRYVAAYVFSVFPSRIVS